MATTGCGPAGFAGVGAARVVPGADRVVVERADVEYVVTWALDVDGSLVLVAHAGVVYVKLGADVEYDDADELSRPPMVANATSPPTTTKTNSTARTAPTAPPPDRGGG
ncbi:hypothetical protein [Nocardia mikamii]|uniref:hypothetical protein n=1 Tax=Nocardia mikamii TaxID=508464 RepID=UPI001432055F|nr:hypothetical protein [Nocardia mikamii]